MNTGDQLILIVLNAACLLAASGIVVFEPEQKTRFRLSLLIYIVAAFLLALYLPAEKYGLLKKMKNLSVVRSIILVRQARHTLLFCTHLFVGCRASGPCGGAYCRRYVCLRIVDFVCRERDGDLCRVDYMLFSWQEIGKKVVVLAV